MLQNLVAIVKGCGCWLNRLLYDVYMPLLIINFTLKSVIVKMEILKLVAMKFYTTIPKKLKPHYDKEIESFHAKFSNGHLADAWNHLERAHIIGQKYPYAHTSVHWKMLKFGFRIKNRREIIGQIPRLIFGGVKSFVGKVPIGNPGGANVPPLKPFPIEHDLQQIFIKAGIK